jgi:hypothetical protein
MLNFQHSEHDGDEAMTYAAHHSDFAFGSNASTTSNGNASKVGVLRRIFDAMFESRQRQADRQIAAFVAGRGGRFTDELEREIMRRLLTSDWSARG